MNNPAVEIHKIIHSPNVPQYLEPHSRHVPHQRVRDPIHGFIHYSAAEREIIDDPIFQRLRRIKQLALNYYIYPGATHTRFEHSLGVMDLATRAFDFLIREHGDKLDAHFKEVPQFQDDTIARVRQFIRLFALLHDIGHTPFSHAGEGIVDGGRHEDLSGLIVKKPELLGDKLENLFFPGVGALLHDMVTEKEDIHPKLALIKRLVSGQIDFDRSDYLLRDSHHIGVEYGRFDIERLLESITIKTDKLHGFDIALKKGGLHLFEALVLARYQMNTQVYYHRLRRLFDKYLENYLKLWAPMNYKAGDVTSFLQFDDYDLMHQIKHDSKDTTSEIGKWAYKIHNRYLYKLIIESGDHADPREVKCYYQTYEYLRKEFPDIDFIFDHAKSNIHKLYVKGEEETGLDDFFVIDKDDNPVRLTEYSGVVAKLPRKFNSVRIFADIADKTILNRVKEYAKTSNHELME